MRIYFAQVIGTGTAEDRFRTSIRDHITRPNSWNDIDCRADASQAAGFMMSIVYDPTAQEHAAIIADSRIKYLPLENAGGDPLTLSDTVGDIDSTKLAAIKAELEQRHIPFGDITGADTIRSALKRIIKRFLLRQILKAYDFDENCDLLISSIPAVKRQAIAASLQDRGFAIEGIIGTMTVRQALIYLLSQPNGWIKSGL